MATRTVVVTMGPRRRSALELRNVLAASTGSVASQLLARYRRASLQDDAMKQHDVLLQLTKPDCTPHGSEGSDYDEHARGKCSHRSSISTVNEEDETAPTAVHHKAKQTLDAAYRTPESNGEDSTFEKLAAEAEDCLMPLPTEVVRRRRISVETTTSAPGATTLVPRRRKISTVPCEPPSPPQLDLFREEAEYSDYMDAFVTGAHTEVNAVVYYQLDVHLSQMKWQVLRRYSEFYTLRQRLLAQLARRTQHGTCRICANIRQTLEQAPFPSRTQRQPWFSLFGGRLGSRKRTVRAATIIADRKRELQGFVAACLLTVRGLRQHSRLLRDSSACEVSVPLRMIEEFLGLSFTRYMRFLNERGVLETSDEATTPSERKGKTVAINRRSLVREARLPRDSEATRRATMAV